MIWKGETMRKFLKFVTFAMVFGIIAGVTLQGYNFMIDKRVQQSEDSKERLENEKQENEDEASVESMEASYKEVEYTDDISNIAEAVMPSIVAINSMTVDTTQDFFGRQYSREIPESGSGIIIGQNRKEILIVTNNHVIEGATSLEVVFDDDTTAPATLKGATSSVDIAILSVELKSLDKETVNHIRIATLGNSDNVQHGEMAIAIGNALGYGQSVTVGYISAINREVTINNRTMNLIQTDAAINPGNSGGALLNVRGEVIGINAVKLVSTEVENMGYAIPITNVVEIINQLMNRNDINQNEQAYLGIAGKDITDLYSQGFNMPIGVFVSEVIENSAAEQSGIKVGDIIIAVNNLPVESQEDLQEALRYIEAGSAGTITVRSLDNGEYVERVLDITFHARP
jgi:serine protease Do